MWDLPGPGLEPGSPALAGGFLTIVPPGKSRCFIISELLFVDFSSIVFNQYGEDLCFVETIQCNFIIEDYRRKNCTQNVCLNLYKFGCYLIQIGTLPKVCILGMVLLMFYKINRCKEDEFPFFFQLNPKCERQVSS